jgi:hypothetical protein
MPTEITGNSTIDGLILLIGGSIGLVFALRGMVTSIASFGSSKEQIKPKADTATPSGIQSAASLLFATAGLFMFVAIAFSYFGADSQFWRIAWISIVSLVGVLWIWTAYRVKQGSHSARWASIPFLVVAFLSLPLLGWIMVPFAVYGLFINKSSRQFFQGSVVARPHRIRVGF